MIQHIIILVGGVVTVGVISIFLFFAVFIGASLWAFNLKKPLVNALETLPMEDGESNARNGALPHE